jgi:glycosyltransferase involved in cell wall biosynthesis
VALEFQAAGCPVVTTDIRALPEINSDECGWVVPVPKNRLGEAIYTSPTSRVALAAAITDGLEGVVHGAFADRSSLARKGAAALARVQREHSSAEYGQRLAAIYSAALG